MSGRLRAFLALVLLSGVAAAAWIITDRFDRVTVHQPQPPAHQTTPPTTMPPPPPAAPPTPVAKGQTADDGPFAVKTGGTLTETKLLNRPAQGIYVEVFMDIKNITGTPQTYLAEYQKLQDRTGRQYAPDLAITEGEWSDRNMTRIDINPGNTAVGVLIFDLPAETQPDEYVLLFHASPSSPGIAANIN
jgi:hypothetical protein